MSVPAYPEYKDSGVPWLGDVPSTWKVTALRRVLRECASGLAATQIEEGDDTVGITRIESISKGTVDCNKIGYIRSCDVVEARKIKKFDILLSNINSLSMIGNCAQADLDLNIYAGMNLLHLRIVEEVSPRYMFWQIRSPFFRRAIESSAKPAINQASIPQSSLLALTVCWPSYVEQTAIAAFLDRETAKIDALVAEQQRLIALLKEKRQAVISHAVTKGLNPNAPMKDSCIEWLGEIPAHWEAARVKHCCSVKGRIGFRGYTADDLVPEGDGALVLGGTNMASNGSLTLEKRTYLTWNKYEESPEIMIFEGDVIIGQRGTCGNAVYVDRDLGPTTINPSLVVLKRLTVDGQFLTFSINAAHVQSVVDSIVSKTAVPMISQEQIGNMPIALPPAEEQVHITEQLTKRAFDFDNLIGEAQSAITLLQERRAALISAAVTGKIDVRGLVVAPAELETA